MYHKISKLGGFVVSLLAVFISQSLAEAQASSESVMVDLSFAQVTSPQTDSEKRQINATKTVILNGQEKSINFHIIAKSGDKIGQGIYGLLWDYTGNPLLTDDATIALSHKTDFSSLIATQDKLYMISHFESLPSAMYLTELNQQQNGLLKAVNTQNINASGLNGFWKLCAGSLTPWNSHLGAEENEPDAAKVSTYLSQSKPNLKDEGVKNYWEMAKYFAGDMSRLNPYDYGWMVEASILNEPAKASLVKHYAMGRFSHELAYVMPDKKTVYLSDDDANAGLFMFVADQAGDLSAGILYAAKWQQRSQQEAGSANLQWISLGHSDNATIQQAINKKVSFADLFERSDKATEGFQSVNTTKGQEYLRLKPEMQEIASRLESRRYAALKGATTEFNKMEGISYNPEDNTLYLALSSIGKGMEDHHKKGKPNDKYDKLGFNHIKLAYNPCGAVYALNMSENLKHQTKDGQFIDSVFVASTMTAFLEGKLSSTEQANICALDTIANPDNISFIPGSNTLIIAEDSKKGHQNDALWSYHIKSKKLTRLLTSPYGAEVTSAYYYNNINQHAYLMSVIQHPYDEEDALNSKEKMRTMIKTINDRKAVTGYIGPLAPIK